MPSEPPPEKLLLVEGDDDKYVVEHLQRIHGLPTFAVRSCGPVEQLIAAIGPELSNDNRTVLGVLVDADDQPQDRWDEIVKRFAKENVAIPVASTGSGTILEEHSTRIGIWMMPDNLSPGELEDFIESMIPQDDPAWLCADEYIRCIPEEQRKFKEGKLLRAKVHAWLATRELPGRPGAAIGAGDLATDGELAQRFVGWLRRLFE